LVTLVLSLESRGRRAAKRGSFGKKQLVKEVDKFSMGPASAVAPQQRVQLRCRSSLKEDEKKEEDEHKKGDNVREDRSKASV